MYPLRAAFFAGLMVLTGPASAQSERGSDAAVRAIIQTSLDEALHDQVKHLFEVWMRDSTGQPQRAATGIRKAVAAYRHAIRAIDVEKLARK